MKQINWGVIWKKANKFKANFIKDLFVYEALKLLQLFQKKRKKNVCEKVAIHNFEGKYISKFGDFFLQNIHY